MATDWAKAGRSEVPELERRPLRGSLGIRLADGRILRHGMPHSILVLKEEEGKGELIWLRESFSDWLRSTRST